MARPVAGRAVAVRIRRATLCDVFPAARLFATLGAAFAAVLFATAPALAHDTQGLMTAEARPATDAQAVTARARIVYANDGHPAGEAAVTVTGTGPGGAQAVPTTLTPVDDGEYEAVIALPAPGEWSLQFSATNPAATATTTHTVSAPTTTAAPTSEPRRAIQRSDDDSSGLNASLVVIGGAVVVAALVGVVLVMRRRR